MVVYLTINSILLFFKQAFDELCYSSYNLQLQPYKMSVEDSYKLRTQADKSIREKHY